jgi:hypothetical protein
MKLTKIILSVLAFATALIACEKAGLRLTEYSLPTDKAFVRVVLLSPGTPNVMIKANDVKLNGANTGGNGGIFPSTFTFPDYAAVTPNATIKLSLPNTGTQNDSVVLFSSNLGGLVANKYYALTLSDTGINRTVFNIEDQFLPQKDSFLSVRLINATVGSSLTFIRVDSNSATDVVRDTLARDVAYKASSGFISVKTFTTRAFIRLRTFNSNGLNIAGQVIPPQTLATGSRRSITVYSTGNIASTTAPFAPALITNAVTNQ